MSRDAQHRTTAPISRHLSELAADRLLGRGYSLPPDFHVLCCPCCHDERTVLMRHEIFDHEWRLTCGRCGHSSQRGYYDPITAVAAWNTSQPDRPTKPQPFQRTQGGTA